MVQSVDHPHPCVVAHSQPLVLKPPGSLPFVYYSCPVLTLCSTPESIQLLILVMKSSLSAFDIDLADLTAYCCSLLSQVLLLRSWLQFLGQVCPCLLEGRDQAIRTEVKIGIDCCFCFFNLFIFGCSGSLLLCTGFLYSWQAGATLHCQERASHYRQFLSWSRGSRLTGFSICGHGLSCSIACGIFPE